MKRLIRLLAVIALALSPVWGYSSDVSASGLSSPERYPIWPSFLSTGCTALQGPGGSTSVSCGGGSFLLSQINSGYACNNVDISISSFQQGSFLVVGTVNSGSQSNAVQIDGPGDYYMQFPGFLTNNLVTIQMTAGSNGSAMTVGGITSSACAVVTDTNTPNPSFTATNTPLPVTGTPTAIPTHTPLPSGHSTFTPTVSPTGTVIPPTHTPTVSPTPGISYRDCGQPTFPLLNCDAIGGGGFSGGAQADFWTLSAPVCTHDAGGGIPANDVLIYTDFALGMVQAKCSQNVTAHATGTLNVRYTGNVGAFSAQVTINGVTQGVPGTLTTEQFGSVTNGNTYAVTFLVAPSDGAHTWFYIDNAFVSPNADTPTVAPTFTATPSSTPLPGTPTNTPVPTDTLVPIPGAMSTAIATSTECPGGCAVAALTAIPGLSTITTVDTSPFSQLQHLSLARNGCTAFGYVQIPYPVIHGTPALGTSNPISVTWTLPVTHDWDNTNPYSNTAIEPCAMNEIPTFVWDFTYWLSVFACSVIFIMWLIGLVGRLSGEETING